MLNVAAANSLFLWMFPLVGLPILFHLFLRVRKRTRPFPSLMFFRQADPRMQARRKIREWLALLLRMLLILALLLALSRPVWLGGQGGGPVAAVLVIDNSGSMSASGGDGHSKLSKALEGAAALIGDLRPSDTAALVLLVDDVTAAMPEGWSGEREVLRSALARVRDTEASGAPARALERATALLAASSASRQEIHVFTDLQQTEWESTPAAPPGLPLNAAVTVHRMEPAEAQPVINVSVTETLLPKRRLLAGRPYTLSVGLRNTSDHDAPVRVATIDAAGKKRLNRIDLPAQASRVLSVPIETASPGTGWMRVRVENDDFTADNTAYVVYSSSGRQPVWFMGAPQDFGLLVDAVSPAGEGLLSGLLPVFRKDAFAPPGPDEPAPALVVYTWHTLPTGDEEQTALRAYVEKGGSLLAVPGPSEQREVITLPPWIGTATQQRSVSGRGQPMLVFDRLAVLWDELRNEAGEVMLQRVKAFRFYPLTVSAPAVALAGLEDGRALMAQRPLGQGRIYISGMAFESSWTTLPLRAGFLPLVQSMATLAAPDNDGAQPLVAGQRHRPDVEEAVPLRVHAVAGSPMDWRGTAMATPSFPRGGVYAVDVDGRTTYVAVRSSEREGQARFVSGRTVPAMGTAPHDVRTYRGRESFIRSVRRHRTGLALYLPLVLLALAAVTIEACIVNPLPRKAVPVK